MIKISKLFDKIAYLRHVKIQNPTEKKSIVVKQQEKKIKLKGIKYLRKNIKKYKNKIKTKKLKPSSGGFLW